ncbi:MAG: sugar ABC transporter permease [Actinomyces sp.]|jgi:raffinose/stachyose/melibiose transport system permease protein|nr:sugar ABC transporter permease [Actinomyces sp.]MCI1641582.1 sugar ABC transporter permease [Actinomyces sp.]MCI1661680.1 sugar ABC transporter permease [Actinomyces sp.]MCI1691144.1 sugar ABC transporter permease [Actinomyces sp.]MCI1787621.1 sugar ABC transporter permease [Actinomyces sp.]MCI1830171.1 sugar ABC transporter permease [Actinomyces sp.]
MNTGTPALVGRAPSVNKSSRLRGASVNLMYLPVLILFAIFIVYPVINGVGIAMTNWDGYSPTRANVGLSNFQRLVGDANFLVALRNTFVYGFGSTLIQQVFGLLLAVLLDTSLRGRNIARAIIYLPVLVSSVVMGTMYYLVFRYNQGALNDFLGLFGVDQVAWLSDSGFAIGVIVLINSLQFMGISMLIYLSGLQSIPSEVKEAASLDGATGFVQFRKITVPLLLPAFASSCVINLIGGLKLYDIVQVLTGGGPGYSTNSVSTLIGKTYFGNQSAGYAAAQGIVLFLLIAVFTVVMNLWFDRRRNRLEN